MKNLDETMVRINVLRAAIRQTSYTHEQRYKLIDVTRGNAQGENYELRTQRYVTKHYEAGEGYNAVDMSVWEDQSVIAVSHTVCMPNVTNKIGGYPSYGPVFFRIDLPADLLKSIEKIEK